MSASLGEIITWNSLSSETFFKPTDTELAPSPNLGITDNRSLAGLAGVNERHGQRSPPWFLSAEASETNTNK